MNFSGIFFNRLSRGVKLSCLWFTGDRYLCEHAPDLSFKTTKMQDIAIFFKLIYDKLGFLMARFEVKSNYMSYKPHFYDPLKNFGI